MKKLIFTLTLLLGFQFTNAQKLIAYQQIINEYGNKAYPLSYTRMWYNNSNIYVTIYNLFTKTGKHIITIKAVHDKPDKTIIVDVKDPNGGVFSHINSESTTYDNPNLEPFGETGGLVALGGKSMPYTLAVQFTDRTYTKIKVITINGTRGGDENMIYYSLKNEFKYVNH